jgi:hypothetical protein
MYPGNRTAESLISFSACIVDNLVKLATIRMSGFVELAAVRILVRFISLKTDVSKKNFHFLIRPQNG